MGISIKGGLAQKMEHFYAFIAALAVGVLVALAGYFLNLRATRQERKEEAEEYLRGSIHGILAELETNLNIARQPFESRLVPFLVSIWEVHKGEILELPEEMRGALYEAYVEIQMTNALVQTDLYKITFGRGYYDGNYQEKCKIVAQKAEKAINLIKSWFAAKETGEGN